MIMAFLLSLIAIVGAEDITQDGKEWHTISTWHGTIYNSSTQTNPDVEEDNERKIEPAPQPTLDLPTDRVFIITPLVISLVVLLVLISSLQKKYYVEKVMA